MSNDVVKGVGSKVAAFFNAPPPTTGSVFNSLDWIVVAMFVVVLLRRS